MLPAETSALGLTAASIGFVHTLLGPDHYLPFVALARAREWSIPKTLGITLGCGIGHVAGSVVLGSVGLALGWAVAGMEAIEGLRGDLAGWMLLTIGLVYLAWGIGRATGRHGHRHAGAAGDPAPAPAGSAGDREGDPDGRFPEALPTPWLLFVVFVFGPCEPLIPVLMVPAARGSVLGVAWVTAVFAAATLATMLGAVLLGTLGLARLRLDAAQRWGHAAAGATLAACGGAVVLGL